jgi:hypothetical protein
MRSLSVPSPMLAPDARQFRAKEDLRAFDTVGVDRSNYLFLVLISTGNRALRSG